MAKFLKPNVLNVKQWLVLKLNAGNHTGKNARFRPKNVIDVYVLKPSFAQFYPVKPGFYLVLPRFYLPGWAKPIKPRFFPTLFKHPWAGPCTMGGLIIYMTCMQVPTEIQRHCWIPNTCMQKLKTGHTERGHWICTVLLDSDFCCMGPA